ncbi:MAG: DUF4384 domain-containing protein [Candidatus Hydrogenedentes bacterium]|nr:DUF4384 domain-containing protein [Candidatus Hydrogenedentota bacterium]
MTSNHRLLWAMALLTLAAVSGCVQPQPEPQPQPAEPTQAPAADTGNDAATMLELGIAVEPEHGPPGQTVGPDYFHGDQNSRFRLVFMPAQEGFCYVVNRGSSGNFDLLFPNRAAGLTNNMVKAGETLRVPPEGPDSWLRFSDTPGAENVTVFLSKNRIEALEQLFSESPVASDRVQAALAQLTEDAALGGNLSSQASEKETKFTFTAPDASAYLKAGIVLHHD